MLFNSLFYLKITLLSCIQGWLRYTPKHRQSMDSVKSMHLLEQPTRWVVWCPQEGLRLIHSAKGEENVEVLSLLATWFYLGPWRLQPHCAPVFSGDVLTNITCTVYQGRAIFFSLHSVSLSGFIGSSRCTRELFIHIQQYHLGPTSFAMLFQPQQLKERRGLSIAFKNIQYIFHKLKDSGKCNFKTQLNHKADIFKGDCLLQQC